MTDNTLSSLEDAAKENIPPTFTTPSAPRFRNALASPAPSTPKHRVQFVGKVVTPRSNRTACSVKQDSVYAAARHLFTQSSNPSRLIGREKERQCLQHFITNGIQTQQGGCTYVSGPPGTGKSALVQELLEDFQARDDVNISVINCVTVRSSSMVLGKLSQDLGLTGSAHNIGKSNLAKAFTSKSKKGMHLVLMDEIDSLLDGDCDLLYSLFEWALHRSSCLILIGIANALDLTDRFLPLLKARNLRADLLPFMPYTAPEMSNIITQKLQSLLPANSTAPGFVPFLHPAAIQLIGKKIASQTGDLRKAFTLARRAIDEAEQLSIAQVTTRNVTPTKQPLSELANLSGRLPPTPPKSSPLKVDITSPVASSAVPTWTVETAPRASISHVAKLASSIFNSGTLSRLGSLNLQQKTVLCSLVANEKRQMERDPFKTPSKRSRKNLTIKDLFEKYGRLCHRDDGLLQPLKTTEFRDVVASLETLGLVHEFGGRGTSLLTPTKTPSRAGRNIDDRQLVSAVSEKEMKDSIDGPGKDLLQRLFEQC